MFHYDPDKSLLVGPQGTLPVRPGDQGSLKMAMLLQGGLKTDTTSFQTIGPLAAADLDAPQIDGRDVIPATDGWEQKPEFIRLASVGQAGYDVFRVEDVAGTSEKLLRQGQSVRGSGANKFIDGAPNGVGDGQRQLQPVGHVSKLPGGKSELSINILSVNPSVSVVFS